MSRAATLAGYVAIGLAIAVHELVARRARRRTPHGRPWTTGELVAALTRSGPTRWPVLAAWLWLGWHLFARVDWS